MGLSHPVSLYGQARGVDSARWPWPKPPKIARRWYGVVSADQAAALEWQRETLAESLNGIDLHCLATETPETPQLVSVAPRWALWSDGDYTASLLLKTWPRDVAPGWLGQALSGETPVDVAIHFAPKDPQKFARYLKKQQRWQSDELRQTDDAASELGVIDARTTRKKLVATLDRPCRVAIILTVHASSPGELESRVQTIIYSVGLKLADVVRINLEHDRGREATEPLGVCRVVGAYRTLDCTAVAYTGIFQPPTIEHSAGVDLGITHGVGTFNKGAQLVRLDPFDESLEGFSGVVVGKKRMGKSYFMKVFARGLARRGVEVTIVEQRRPPEYAVLSAEPNVHVVNVEELASDDDAPDEAIAKRAAFLRRFTTEYWNRCRSDPRPRMLVIDEAWALLRHAQSSAWIEEVARTCGHFGLSFWLLSQQVREFLQTGEAVLDNAEIIVCLKQLDNDLDDLAHAIGMPNPARAWLRGAGRGQVLIKVGDMWVACDVARVPEHYEITTDPRDIWNRIDNHQTSADDADEDNSHDDVGDSASEDRAPSWSDGRVRLRDRGHHCGGAAAVGAVR
jgi:hypothetical protein